MVHDSTSFAIFSNESLFLPISRQIRKVSINSTYCIYKLHALIHFHLSFERHVNFIQFPSIWILFVHYVSARRTSALILMKRCKKSRWIWFENIFDLIEIMSECMNMHRIINNTCIAGAMNQKQTANYDKFSWAHKHTATHCARSRTRTHRMDRAGERYGNSLALLLQIIVFCISEFIFNLHKDWRMPPRSSNSSHHRWCCRHKFSSVHSRYWIVLDTPIGNGAATQTKRNETKRK